MKKIISIIIILSLLATNLSALKNISMFQVLGYNEKDQETAVIKTMLSQEIYKSMENKMGKPHMQKILPSWLDFDNSVLLNKEISAHDIFDMYSCLIEILKIRTAAYVKDLFAILYSKILCRNKVGDYKKIKNTFKYSYISISCMLLASMSNDQNMETLVFISNQMKNKKTQNMRLKNIIISSLYEISQTKLLTIPEKTTVLYRVFRGDKTEKDYYSKLEKKLQILKLILKINPEKITEIIDGSNRNIFDIAQIIFFNIATDLKYKVDFSIEKIRSKIKGWPEILNFYGKLKSLNCHTMLSYAKKIIELTITNQYKIYRYSNEHCQKIIKIMGENFFSKYTYNMKSTIGKVLKNIKIKDIVNAKFVKNKLNYIVEETDSISKIVKSFFTIKTCLTQDRSLVKFYLGYLLNGWNKFFLIRKEDGSIIARKVMKLALNDQNVPVFMVDDTYPLYISTYSICDTLLNYFCQEKARMLNINIVWPGRYGNLTNAIYKEYPHNINFLKGNSKYEYQNFVMNLEYRNTDYGRMTFDRGDLQYLTKNSIKTIDNERYRVQKIYNLYGLKIKENFEKLDVFKDIKIIRHRAHDWKTVNEAMKENVYGFEIDIHYTADGKLALIHDPKKTYRGKEYCTYQLTMKQLREAFGNTEIFTLKQFLNLPYMENIKLTLHIHNWFSHIKGYNEKVTTRIVEVLKNTKWMNKNFVDNVESFISFDMKQLHMMKELLPNASVAYCVDDHKEKGLYAIDIQKHLTVKDLINRLKKQEINKIVYPSTAMVFKAVQKLKEASIKILSGVTIPKSFINVEGIILDDVIEFRNMRMKV